MIVLDSDRAYGVFPGVTPNALESTWHHEVIHAIQSQQLDSVEPPLFTVGGEAEPGEPRRLFLFRHVRLGVLHAANLATFQREYRERWFEVEAYGLAEGTPVQH